MDFLLLVIMGVLAGVSSSLLGIGGGIFFVPLLPIVSEMSQREVIATSLMAILFISSLNSYFFHRNSLMDWKTIFILSPGAILGACLGVYGGYYFSDLYLQIIGIVWLAGLAGKVLWGMWVSKLDHRYALSLGWVVLGSLFVGVFSGLTGIGTGLLLSALLLSWKRIKNTHISPISNGVMIFTTLFGSLVFLRYSSDVSLMRLGEAHMDKVWILFISSSISAYFGRKYQDRLSLYWRRSILAYLLLFLVVQMIIVSVRGWEPFL